MIEDEYSEPEVEDIFLDMLEFFEIEPISLTKIGKEFFLSFSIMDLNKFLNLVAKFPDNVSEEHPLWETLYGRITERGSNGDWIYHFEIDNHGEDGGYFSGTNNFVTSVTIQIPLEDDIGYVTDILYDKFQENHNEIKKLNWKKDGF